MAGDLLRGDQRGRDPGAAQRLVDRRRARVRAARFGSEDPVRRRRAARAAQGALCRAARARAGDRQPRAGRSGGHRQPARGADRDAARLGVAARDRLSRGRARPRGRCHAVLHQRDDGQSQGRARHASQHHDQHPLDRLFAGARAAAPRRDPARGARAQGRAAGDPAVSRHRVQRRADGDGRDRGHRGVHAPLGPAAGDGDHRAREGQHDRRGADDRLAIARASRTRDLRPVVARFDLLRRRAPRRPSW